MEIEDKKIETDDDLLEELRAALKLRSKIKKGEVIAIDTERFIYAFQYLSENKIDLEDLKKPVVIAKENAVITKEKTHVKIPLTEDQKLWIVVLIAGIAIAATMIVTKVYMMW